MGREAVPFPHWGPNWALVRDLLSQLQDLLLNEAIDAQDVALYMQVIYDASQSPQPLDPQWAQRQHHPIGAGSQGGARRKVDASYLWHGMLHFLRRWQRHEAERFLFTVLPSILELALRAEENVQSSGPVYRSQQQKRERTVLSRQLAASILACSFLCLFPEQRREPLHQHKITPLNFTRLFKKLPEPSQEAKLRCILHYFQRTAEGEMERPGSIVFRRQVVERRRLWSLEEVLLSERLLCSLLVHSTGSAEDVASSAMQVECVKDNIGEGVLEGGVTQADTRFFTCPELMAAILLTEKLEANEALVVSGFERFSACHHRQTSVEFAGSVRDKAERDSAGNLLTTLCAIDPTSYEREAPERQFTDACLLRELLKAYVGFKHAGEQDYVDSQTSDAGVSPEWAQDFSAAATRSSDIEGETGRPSSTYLKRLEQVCEVMAKSLLSQGMVETVRTLRPFPALPAAHPDGPESGSRPGRPPGGEAEKPRGGHGGHGRSSSPREDASHAVQVPRESGSAAAIGGNGERLSLPLLAPPRPQNGSHELLEVDYGEWLTHFRRRSSQLSDLTSRRSSSSTKHSSEFSSDLEEIYETLVQAEKAQHGVIQEENYSAALSEFATHFVDCLLDEGTTVAAQMLPGLRDFHEGPPQGTLRPVVVRPSPLPFPEASQGTESGSSFKEVPRPQALSPDGGGLFVADSGKERQQEREKLLEPLPVTEEASLAVERSRIDGTQESETLFVEQSSLDVTLESQTPFVEQSSIDATLQTPTPFVKQSSIDVTIGNQTPFVEQTGVDVTLESQTPFVEESSIDVTLEGQAEYVEQSSIEPVSASNKLFVEQSSIEPVNASNKLFVDQSRLQVPPKVQTCVDSLVTEALNSGVAEAASRLTQQPPEVRLPDNIPEDVHRWFADKIIQEVFAHVVDELYFQRFASDFRLRSSLPVNREGVQQRSIHTDSDSLTAPSSGSEAFQSGHNSQGIAERTPPMAKKTKDRLQRQSVVHGESDRLSQSSKKIKESTGQRPEEKAVREKRSMRSQTKSLSVPSGAALEERTFKTNRGGVRTLSQSSDGDGLERREERKSVTFTVEETKQASKADPVKGLVRRDADSRVKTPRPAVTHRYVVKDVPVPITRPSPARVPGSPVKKEASVPKLAKPSYPRSKEWKSSKCAESKVSYPPSMPYEKDGQKPAPSQPMPSSFIALSSSSSSIPKARSSESSVRVSSVSKPPLPSPPHPPASRAFKPPPASPPPPCDKPSKPADSRDTLLGKRLSPSKRRQSTSSEDSASSVPVMPGVFDISTDSQHVAEGSGAATSHEDAASSEQLPSSEQGAGASLSSSDLNLDCYRAAAAIVNQVFQSLPDHLTPSEMQALRDSGGPSSFYYQGRKYESVVPRGTYETAAAVIGASEKGNVVSETFVQSKAVAEGMTVPPSSSPRRTRSQSPCVSWLTKRLSRETLTNAFVKVESRQSVSSYERRSSEPCQRSVTLSLQAFSSGRLGHSIDSTQRNQRHGLHADEDLSTMKGGAWRRGSFDSVSLWRRRSSCGFKDPVLSRFAQELLKADTSVPRLFLPGSGSSASTASSRRSSLSGFRDNTLATFESELLTSAFSLNNNGGGGGPRPKLPKRSHSRESRLWMSDSSETEHWFPVPRLVGAEFREKMERGTKRDSSPHSNLQDYADRIAATILQQAISDGNREVLHPDQTRLHRFAENLADLILLEALTASVTRKPPRRRKSRRVVKKSKSVCDSELDFSVSSNDLTARSLEDRLLDFQDTLDLSADSVETYAGGIVESMQMYAGGLAESVLAAALEELGSALQRDSRPAENSRLAIATSNWGCSKELGGDPCLKMALQWMSASLARCPKVLYFTQGHPAMGQTQAVVDFLSRESWTVGRLMVEVRAYCHHVLGEIESWKKTGPATGRRFVPSCSLFDYLLNSRY